MKQEFKILLIEDQQSFRDAVIQLLGVYNEIKGVSSKKEAKELLSKIPFEVVILDRFLPDGDGIDLIPEIKSDSPNTVVIVLTADNDFNSVKKCIQIGADDYVIKSPNIIPELLVRIPLAAARVASERSLTSLQNQIQKALRYELVGRSKQASELRLLTLSSRGSKASILITGESGSGKEVIARRLHAVEEDRNRPFVFINCGALPEQLIESELFGYKKGAFTGANVDKAGLLEAAHGGDLFLDEIGELPLQSQTKLLRVLQDRMFYRLGGNKPVEVSCRIISATNQDLEEMVRRKKFREDLYYRLNVVRLRAPSLRTRIEDIPDLVQHFLIQIGFPNMSVSESGFEKLARYDWPGNIRELGNVIERGVIGARTRQSLIIDREDLQFDRPLDAEGAGARRLEMALPNEKSELSEMSYQIYMDLAEKEYLKRLISLHDGNVALAANSIGMSRSNLFRKISALGISKRSNSLNPTEEYLQSNKNSRNASVQSLNL